MRPELHEVPERRSRPESAEQLSLRAEHVVHAYLAAHPDYTLREEVEAGRLPIEKAYRIMKESARDPKTGVQRSDLLKYALEYEMYQTRETGEPVTVAVFDIDDFKRINTELTHVGADGVLKRVADIITEEVRQSDDVLPGAEEESVVRWGGEEFVVVFSQTNRDAAHFAAERIRARIAAELTTVRPNGEAVTISGGLAEYRTAEPSEVDNLLRAADEQLLAAKKSGKNIILPVPERAAA